jgi:glutathione S-transferase
MHQPEITLFDKAECPFCWKVRLALAIKNLPFAEITIDTDAKPESFLALSATGKVPLLQIDGELITESSTIIDALEARYSTPSLFGQSPQQRTLTAELNLYSDTVIGPAIRDAIFTQRGRPQSEWDTEAIEHSKLAWRGCLHWLAQKLAAPTAFAGDFSLAECALLPRFGLATAYGLHQAEEFPALNNWFEHHRKMAYYQTTAPLIARA